jgi:hypothetical protein
LLFDENLGRLLSKEQQSFNGDPRLRGDDIGAKQKE